MNRIGRLRKLELQRNVTQAKLDVLITINDAVQRVNKALQQLRA